MRVEFVVPVPGHATFDAVGELVEFFTGIGSVEGIGSRDIAARARAIKVVLEPEQDDPFEAGLWVAEQIEEINAHLSGHGFDPVTRDKIAVAR